MQGGKLLLASSGKEFVKPTGIFSNSLEVKKARKEAMGRLGLDFLDTVGGEDDMDLEKELVADVEPDLEIDMENSLKIEEHNQPLSPAGVSIRVDVKMERSLSRSDSVPPATPTSSTPTAVSANVDESVLSARERNRLKRKRKPGNNAFVAAPPPSGSGSKYNTAAAGPSNKCVSHERLIYFPPVHLRYTGLV
jgi:TATA-binding protein-associated factor